MTTTNTTANATAFNLETAKSILNNDINSSLAVSGMVVDVIDNFYQELGNPVALKHLVQALSETLYAEKSSANYKKLNTILSSFTARSVEMTTDDNGNKTQVVKNGQWVVKKNVKGFINVAKRQGLDVSGLDENTSNSVLAEKLFTPMQEKWEEFKDAQTFEDVVNIFAKPEKSDAEKKAEAAKRKERKEKKDEADKKEFGSKGVQKQAKVAKDLGISPLDHIKALVQEYTKGDDAIPLAAVIEMLSSMED